MRLPSIIQRLHLPFSHETEDTRHESELKAVRMLGARSLSEARREAAQALKHARSCDCCRSLLDHLFDRLGSTLFLDDDPQELAQAFEETERDRFCPRVLAACIVLRGRARVLPA
jgi:hypothetical protein